MRLYVETMDATIVDISPDGRVRFDNEDWIKPSVQERRAIIHAARQAVDDLTDLLQILETAP